MSYTKRQFVTEAYSELGLADYVFDLQPEQLQRALRRLDAMMGEWNARGVKLSYPLVSTPESSSLDTETNVPDKANEAIILNLAVRLAPGLGKTVSPETRLQARNSLETIFISLVKTPEMQFPNTMPLGAGNKSWRYDDTYENFSRDPVGGPITDDNGDLEF